MALTLTVNGVNLLGYVSIGSISVKNTAYSQTGVMSFQLVGRTADFSVQVEHEVILADGATTYYRGYVRNLKRHNYSVRGRKIVDIDCQDVSTLPGDDICDTGAVRDNVFESDADRIDWLFTTFGTKGVTVGAEVQSLRATMPLQDFTGKSLAQALDMIAQLTGASWYVDYDKALHYFLTESSTAPFSFSDTPNYITSTDYKDLEIPDESTALKNAVYVIGKDIASWYEDATSIATYGRREASIKDERITDPDTLDSYGAAFLAANANPKSSGTLKTFTDGFAAGQITYITNADHGLSAVQYRINSVITTFPTQTSPLYQIGFGDPKMSLSQTIKGTATVVASEVADTPTDNEAPSVPQGVAAVGGFRGAAIRWNPVDGEDLMFYQVRWGLDGVTFTTGNINVKASSVWITDLEPDVLYYFQVRAVDNNGNVATSTSDDTPVAYIVYPDAGWCDAVTATPSQVGSADIAANSVTTAMISTAGLSADVINTGTINITPSSGAVTGAEAIEIYNADGVLQGVWHPTNGITIYSTDPADYGVFDDGYLRFYKDSILTAEMGPDGILADSIRLGALSGGHNLILNSSFEMSDFTAVPSTAVFTDNTATPGWKAANRTTAPDNVTESTTLSATTLTYA